MMGYVIENNKWRATSGDPLFLNTYSTQSSHAWDLEMLQPVIDWIDQQNVEPIIIERLAKRVIIPMLGVFNGPTIDEAAYQAVAAYARYHKAKQKSHENSVRTSLKFSHDMNFTFKKKKGTHGYLGSIMHKDKRVAAVYKEVFYMLDHMCPVSEELIACVFEAQGRTLKVSAHMDGGLIEFARRNTVIPVEMLVVDADLEGLHDDDVIHEVQYTTRLGEFVSDPATIRTEECKILPEWFAAAEASEGTTVEDYDNALAQASEDELDEDYEGEFENTYNCPCGHSWTIVMAGQHDDRCGKCRTSCSPTTSEDA